MPTLDRRARIAASILALLTAISIWLSLGTLAVTGGDTSRIAALPLNLILGVLAVALVAIALIGWLRIDDAWPFAIGIVLWLPFLPGPIPPAFLIWQGPIEGVVWAVAIGGLLVARPSVIPRLINDARVAPWIAAALIAIASFAVFNQVRDVVPGGDEPHYLAATQSLLHDGDLKVANNYANGEYLEYFDGHLEPHFLKRSTSGEIYSIHAPGVSVIVLPAFAVAGYRGAVATMIVIAALAAALTWRLAFRVSRSIAGAWIAVAAVFATTPYFFHTFTIYPEIIGSLLVMIGIWLLIELDDGREVSARMLTLVGTALAVLPWLHSRFAVIAALLGLIIIARLLQRSNAMKRIAALLAVPVIAGLGWFAFFYLIWGSPSPTAPYGPDTSTSVSYILRGLIGSRFDQQFGVLTTAPVYVMTIVGGWMLFKQRARFAFELLVIVAAYSATVASYAMWWAGNAAPGRFLVSVLPIAALPIAIVGTEMATIVLLIISIALAVPRGFVEGGRFIFNNRGGVDATIDWITRSVDLSLALPSVHRDGGAVALRDGFLWVVVFAAAVLVARWFTSTRLSAVRYAATAIAAAFTVIVASSIVWTLRDQPVLTPDRSKLAAFAAYRPAWHAAPADFLDRLAIDVPRTTRLDRLPAGEYRMLRDEPWQLVVGRGESLRYAGDRLRLPVMLQSAALIAGAQKLTPVAAVAPAFNQNAIHAAQFGATHVFTFDERAYLEGDGFWIRAQDTATLVFDDASRGASGLPLTVTAGAVRTTVRLSSGRFDQTLSLDAGQKESLTLPPSSDGVWTLTIRSGEGFRPSEREPGSTDVRRLAAWITIQ